MNLLYLSWVVLIKSQLIIDILQNNVPNVVFSENLKSLIESNFSNTNFGRILLLDKFESLINKSNLNKKLKVGVIGGTHDEPGNFVGKNGFFYRKVHFWH